jgi:acid stress-induced BolA-like protein IbaG/YrbA
MAQATLKKLPKYAESLYVELERRLPGAQITLEHRRRDRYTFVIIWDRFSRMGHPERQRLVWDIAKHIIKDSDILKVGMILTMSPREANLED